MGVIFIIAIFVRFYAFKESVYFGFDQARDAYISQDIYLKRDLKLIGPPVSGDVGLFHGPLFWYLIGPIYLLFGVPYKIQTVWSYLFHFYGEKKYGYLPYWETGNVLGFPGGMPAPQSGTTCLRFLGREPTRGLPQVLVEYDEGLEKIFSTPIRKISVGDFTLETRQAIDPTCHNNTP